jgi:hypothetical protein
MSESIGEALIIVYSASPIFFPPLEHKLLVMSENTGKALKIVYSASLIFFVEGGLSSAF